MREVGDRLAESFDFGRRVRSAGGGFSFVAIPWLLCEAGPRDCPGCAGSEVGLLVSGSDCVEVESDSGELSRRRLPDECQRARSSRSRSGSGVGVVSSRVGGWSLELLCSNSNAVVNDASRTCLAATRPVADDGRTSGAGDEGGERPAVVWTSQNCWEESSSEMVFRLCRDCGRG